MNLQLKFKNIVDQPMCKIIANGQELYSGLVDYSYEFDFVTSDKKINLEIEHYNKDPKDTIVNSKGEIVRDKSFELEKIIVDEYDFENLIWKSCFISQSGDIYDSCLFFGPNGCFKIDFDLPILEWILKNTNEPGSWEEDYNYYQKALSIFEKIND